uniref:Mucin 5AC, oligomeric mucus/gel-forming n=1 Tax=Canis lupus dingo TaxID=286419 RepID=A0A8C0KYL8_CANLU
MGVSWRRLAPLWALVLTLACARGTGKAPAERLSQAGRALPWPPCGFPTSWGSSGPGRAGGRPPRPAALNPAHNGRVCSTWGNFHYKTFDGDIFHFPGLCNYVLSAHCGAAYEDFNIQLRRGLESNATTVIRVTMKLDGMVIQLTKNAVLANGQLIQLPFSQSGVLIEHSSNSLKVVARLGLVFMWSQDDSLLLELDAKYANQTCGLCGDFNSEPVFNEFLSHGVKLTPIQFGNLQKMDGPTEQCQDPVPVPMMDCSPGSSICEEILSSRLFSGCSALVDASSYVQACRHDLCACEHANPSSCICHTLAEYSRQCAHAGGLPLDWRGPDLCPQTCPLNMQYRECGSPCADTCSNPEHSQLCEDHCMAGCFCPEGMVLDDIGQTGCIPASQCACVYNGATYAPGAVYSTDCTNCTCLRGQWSCQEVPCPGTCSVLGGAHFSTFDERRYTVHGDCSYVLVKPCNSSTFTVLAELRKCGLTDTETCLRSLTLSLGGGHTVITVKASGEVFVNQIYTQMPISAGNVTLFRPSTFFIIAQTNLGLQLDIQLVPIMQVFVRLGPELRGLTCGLCGNFNQNQADDFRALSGVVEGTAAAFANTWKTQATCPNVKNSFEDPCSLSVENGMWVLVTPGATEVPSGPKGGIQEVNRQTFQRINCMFDTCNCEKSEDCLCAALSSYVHACAANGVLLSGWRDSVCTKPMATCPKSLTYQYHIDTCQPTCRSRSHEDITCGINFVPVDGCTCPTGTFMDDTGKCVPPTSCPCYHGGSMVPNGESLHERGAICTCTQGMLTCIGGQVPTPVCTPPMVYLDCRNATPGATGAGCQKSCFTLDMDCVSPPHPRDPSRAPAECCVPCAPQYSSQCEPGCVCPDGLVSDGKGGCVAVTDCPCVHNEASYLPGQTIWVGCNTCTCKNRMWKCTDEPCLATCAVYGDGHYLTFDGRRYSFSGDCAYTLVQDHCGGNSTANATFRVVTENVPCGTTGVTCSKAIKLFLGSYELRLSGGSVEVIEKGAGQAAPYSIRQMGIYLVVDTEVGLVLLWDRKTSIFLKLSPEFKGRVCGLCGNFDDNAVNDFTTRSQSVVGSTLEFGNSWKFSPSCPDAPAPRDPCTANPYRKSWSQKQCSIINSATFAACHAHVEPAKYYEACVGDACACDSGGDCECFCTAVAAYAQACHDVGVCVSWRTPDICPLFCDYYNPEGQCEWHYQPCGVPCMRTCRNPSGRCLHDLHGLEGCYPKCPPEAPIFDEDQMQCVATCPTPPPPLPCRVQGKSYWPGSAVPSEENCQSCVCTESGVQCVYDAEACVCTYDGSHFHLGDVIYHTTDGTGGCISARCSVNGTIERKVYTCSSTTPAPPTTFSFSTPSLGVSSIHPPRTCHRSTKSTVHTNTPSSALSSTLVTASSPMSHKTSVQPHVTCGEECLWSPWLDVSHPGRGIDSGDFDTLENLRAHGYHVCSVPKEVECQAEGAPEVPLQVMGQHVECSPTVGLVCYNRNQTSGLCYNYQIRILCCFPGTCSTSSTPPPPPASTPTPSRITEMVPTSGVIRVTPVNVLSTNLVSVPTTINCQPRCTWTKWFDVDFPSPGPHGGDVESFSNIMRRGEKICRRPEYITQLECRAESHPEVSIDKLGQVVQCNLTKGLVCRNRTRRAMSGCVLTMRSVCCAVRPQRASVPTTSATTVPTTSLTSLPASSPTSLPKTTTMSAPTTSTIPVLTSETTHSPYVTVTCQPQCTWTKWFDVDFPSPGPHGGDAETFCNIKKRGEKICRRPEYIAQLECRAESHPEVSIDKLGQVVQCNVTKGLVCRNRDQKGNVGMCLNYEVRVLCCETPEGCPHTKTVTVSHTPSVTSPKSVSTTTSTSMPTTGRTSGPETSSTSVPTTAPTSVPTTSSTSVPPSSPTSVPKTSSTSGPTTGPTTVPTTSSTTVPTTGPTSVPTTSSTSVPTTGPTTVPTTSSTTVPTTGPTSVPTTSSTSVPPSSPTSVPEPSSTSGPTTGSTTVPTTTTTSVPTTAPTSVPTTSSTSVPTSSPTTVPTMSSTSVPPSSPTSVPKTSSTSGPTTGPTTVPTTSSTSVPTTGPTTVPTTSSTTVPTTGPTSVPTTSSTSVPPSSPTSVPESSSTSGPTTGPTTVPTTSSTTVPTTGPNSVPTTSSTSVPPSSPTSVPEPSSTSGPTTGSTTVPTTATTSVPTTAPTSVPTTSSTSVPTSSPTTVPTTSSTSVPPSSPTSVPKTSSTSGPTTGPTTVPTTSSTSVPTTGPTTVPTTSSTTVPTTGPTSVPTKSSTSVPPSSPTFVPESSSTSGPTTGPTTVPTTSSTTVPTTGPNSVPTTSSTSVPPSSPTSVPEPSSTSVSTTAPRSVPATSSTPMSTTRPIPVPTTRSTSVPTTSPTSVSTVSTTSVPRSSSISVPITSPTSVPTTSPISVPKTTKTTVPKTSPTSMPTTSSTSVPATSPTSAPKTSSASVPTTSATTVPTTSLTSLPASSPTSLPKTTTMSAPTTSTIPVLTSETTHSPYVTVTCQPQCTWTKWFDVDFPSPGPHGGDAETFCNIKKRGEKICRRPEYIAQLECRAESHPEVSIDKLGQVVQCNVTKGLVCRNRDQKGNVGMCLNYEVRVLCCETPEGSASVPTTSATTVPTTSLTSLPASSPTSLPKTTTMSAPTTSTIPVLTSETTHSPYVTVTCQPQCTWTKWFDVDFPSPGPHGGDAETFCNIKKRGEKICRRPEYIAQLECRAESHPEVSIDKLGQVVQCNVTKGLVCRNRDQKGNVGMCLNYEVRVLCCEPPEHCGHTSVTPHVTSSTNRSPPPEFTSVVSTVSFPSSVAPSTTTCYCSVSGKLYPAGSIIYQQTDLAGHCYYAMCSLDCQVVRWSDQSCSSSVPPPAPTTSPPGPSLSASVPVTMHGCPNAIPPRMKGETWPMPNCSQATCQGNGVITVHPRSCPQTQPPTCTNGFPPVKVTDHDDCCPNYQCQCVCSGWGDPHYITFDGTYYSFLDNCTYVLVQQIVPVYGHFRVLINNYFCGAEDGLSCPQSIIVEYQQARVVMTRKPILGVMTNEIIFNDQVVRPGFQKDGVSVSQIGIKMYVTIPKLGVQVMFSGLIFSVEVPFSKFANNTEGQCGTCSNDKRDECRLPGGVEVASCSAMSSHWRVTTPDQPYCYGPLPTPTAAWPTPSPSSCPPAPVCHLILSKVFGPCHAVIPPLAFYEGCVFDHCHKTDSNVMCSALELYASLCASRGVCIDWRSHTNHTCPFTCPADKVYQPCGPSKPSYCYGSDNTSLMALQDSGPITEGCFCPEGMKLFSRSSEVCVPIDCHKCLGPHGKPVEPGHSITVDCQWCTCENHTLTMSCQRQPCPLPPACPLPGFVPVPAAPQAGQCCPQYNCACDTSYCPKPVACPEGSRPILTYEEGACCPSQNCSWSVCNVNGTLYQPGSVVSSSLCETCRCEAPDGPHSDTVIISCETQICNTHCPVGFEYQPQSGQCCGLCVQQACVVNSSNNSTHLFYPGQSWPDPGNPCMTHECEKHQDGLVVVTTKKACPPLSCPEEQALPSKDGCCLSCPLHPPHTMYHEQQVISQQGCSSPGPVHLAYCQGNCGDSSSRYSLETKAMKHTCQCCQELRVSLRNVTLHCADGSSWVFSYPQVEECGCVGQHCGSEESRPEQSGEEQSEEIERTGWRRRPRTTGSPSRLTRTRPRGSRPPSSGIQG